ncbi:hypothetical protein DFH09DRAFT_1317587 [Mycena vulgaris]|nr:hypothetical protein DFH09DRAFT_1317587 [Mycena vulgaris]
MLVHDLNEDVLLVILSVCDAHTVLTLPTVNKNIRAMAMMEPVRLALVAELTARLLMDPLPDTMLATCSSRDLIAEVRRLVCGPKSWEEGSVATVSRTGFLQLPGRIFLQPEGLLPGGFYLAVHGESCVECWHLLSGRRVWIHQDSRLLTVEMLDGGTSSRCLVLQYNLWHAFDAVTLRI